MTSLLFLIATILTGIAQALIFFYAPLEESMGLIQKIFYYHLPFAILALFSFFLVFIGSIFYLYKKNLYIDCFNQACAEIGVLFSSIALITGMIWGKKAWGVWWTWDPRLTTTFIMWFVYSAYLLIGNLEIPVVRQRLIRAVLGIVAFVDVPLVFLSARFFRSIHPAVFAHEDGSIDPTMAYTAVFCCIALGFFWLALIIFRKNQLMILSKIQEKAFEINF